MAYKESFIKPTGIIHQARRDALPSSDFGLPGERKYPMPDASHAANAESRATQQENAGNITPAQKAQIDAKARAKLHATGHMAVGDHMSTTAGEQTGHPHKNLGKYLHKKGTTPTPAGQHTSTTAAGPRGDQLPQENASGGMGGKPRY